VKFLSLALKSNAQYLVTKDGRHLLRLKVFQNTRIVTPAQFLKILDEAQGHRPMPTPHDL
jgi:predicted nucleic acid-binding protein